MKRFGMRKQTMVFLLLAVLLLCALFKLLFAPGTPCGRLAFRCGVAALLLILRKNGVNLAYTQEELIRLGLDMATNRIDVREVALWIKDHRQE